MKNSVKIVIVITYMLAVLASSCGRINEGIKVKPSGVTKIVTKEVPEFDKIKVSGNFQVIVNIGDASKVVIKADSAFIPYIITGVDKNKKLNISIRKGINVVGYNDLRVIVTTPSLNSLEGLGYNITKIKNLKTDKFYANLLLSSRLEANINCNIINIDCKGGNYIKLQGKANKCYINISGESYIGAVNFITKNLNVNGSISSYVGIFVNDSIEANLSGSSCIYYYGVPKYINTSRTWTSKLVKNNDKKIMRYEN